MFTRGSGGGGPVAVMDLGLGCFHLAIAFVARSPEYCDYFGKRYG